MFCSWRPFTYGSGFQHLRPRLVKKIKIPITSGNKIIDRHLLNASERDPICLCCTDINTKMELLPTTVITDSEIVLEQRWVEAENKFEIKMQMRERGEVKFQTSIKHENFLGASDESINLCLGHLRFTELVNLTRTIMNNCREPLTFSLAKDRLKITDSEGEYYYSYSFYYKDICYFIKEPTFLHEVFWEFLNSILNDEFNFNAFDFMKRFF